MLKILDRYIIKKFLSTFFFSVLVFTLISIIIDVSANTEKVFFTARMAYNSEIISILNAGISFRRLMRPYLIGGFILFGDHFNKRSQKAADFRIEKIVDNKIVYLLKAQSAEWLGPPNKWRVNKYTERTFDGIKEGFVNGEKLTMDTTFNLTPEDFVRYINHKEMLTTPELNKFILKEKGRGVGNTKVYEVELHRRTAEPFTIIILTLIGFAVASRKVRGGMGFQLAAGVGIGAIFIFISKFSNTFSTNDRKMIYCTFVQFDFV